MFIKRFFLVLCQMNTIRIITTQEKHLKCTFMSDQHNDLIDVV